VFLLEKVNSLLEVEIICGNQDILVRYWQNHDNNSETSTGCRPVWHWLPMVGKLTYQGLPTSITQLPSLANLGGVH
jgi:hypothetical protein